MGAQNLRITTGIKGCARKDVDRVLQIVELSARKNSPAATYSLGMKQRMAIAAALLGDGSTGTGRTHQRAWIPQGIAEIRGADPRGSCLRQDHSDSHHLLDEVEKAHTRWRSLRMEICWLTVRYRQ